MFLLEQYEKDKGLEAMTASLFDLAGHFFVYHRGLFKTDA